MLYFDKSGALFLDYICRGERHLNEFDAVNLLLQTEEGREEIAAAIVAATEVHPWDCCVDALSRAPDRVRGLRSDLAGIGYAMENISMVGNAAGRRAAILAGAPQNSEVNRLATVRKDLQIWGRLHAWLAARYPGQSWVRPEQVMHRPGIRPGVDPVYA